MKRFKFNRTEDVSGVSGLGIVAEGIVFSNGTTVIQWCVPGKPNSIVHYNTVEDALKIHGHEGRTTFVWIDE